MPISKVNGERVELLPGMGVNRRGAWDYITYRRYAIYTFEVGTIKKGLYTGPFMVANRKGLFAQEFLTLRKAKVFIDLINS